MRFLYIHHPATGHCNVFLPFAEALKKANHQITFATAHCYKERIENAGFEHITAGMDWDMGELETTIPDINNIPKAERGRWFLEEILLNRAPKKMIPDLLSILDSENFDALICSSWELSGFIVGAIKNIPYAFFNYGFRFSSLDIKRYFGKQYSELRKHFNLSPDPECLSFSKYLSLRMMPRTWLHPYSGTVLENMLKRFVPVETEHFIQPTTFQEFGTVIGEEDSLIGKIKTKSVIYISFGTVYNNMYPALIPAIIDALKDESINIVVSLGDKNDDPEKYGIQPDNVFILNYIDKKLMSHLIPHVDVLFHHGGYGTTMLAISHAVPQVIIPLAGDQPFIANLVIAHGIGKTIIYDEKTIKFIGAQATDPGIISKSMIRERVIEVLNDENYKKNAYKLRAETLELPDIYIAVHILEKMVNSQK